MANSSFSTYLKVVIGESVIASTVVTLSVMAFFASHQPPSLTTFWMLALAATLGTVAAYLAHALQRSIRRHSLISTVHPSCQK